MSDIIAYSSTPWSNQPPDSYKPLLALYEDYSSNWWGDILKPKPQSDMVTAIGWAIVASHQQKLLNTKHNNGRTVLENIDDRLSLYVEYNWYWLNAKDWHRTPKQTYDAFKSYGYMAINHTDEPLTFPQWLYRSGYEALLSDREFLAAIRYFDGDKEPADIESEWLRNYRMEHGFKIRYK